jgi:hypothetical protein
MGREIDRAAREAAGCFIMTILGAILALGVLVAVPAELLAPAREDRRPWWQAILLWIVAPAGGIALVDRLTYGTGWLRRPKRWK